MLEAMACGCALVASDTAPVREVIRHGENGWLVDFFDTGALARRIAAVLEDPAASRALRLRAAATVRLRYGMENGVRQYRALLGLDRAPVRLTSLH